MARTGDKIGPYTLVRQLGRGAYGVVWLAEKKTRITTTEFALKLAIEEDPDLDTIQREAELWKQASGHPNILPIIEADIYDDYVVIVSEFARGGSLEDWLKAHQGAVPSLDAAVQMTSDILSGLEHLHALRIIHRDLKPANVLLQGNRPRLADFGLARVLKSSAFSQTVAGTPEYMAPEAFLNERSEQSDLWAVGVMLYQMVTGHMPFRFNKTMSPLQRMAVITSRDITLPPLSLPDPLREVIIRSLEKRPEHRYHSAREMRAAIIGAAESSKYRSTETSKTFSDWPPDSYIDPSEYTPTETLPDVTPDPPPNPPAPILPKRSVMSRWVSILGAIVVVMGIVTIGIWVLASKNSSPPPPNQIAPSGDSEQAKPNSEVAPNGSTITSPAESPEEPKPLASPSVPAVPVPTHTTVRLQIKGAIPTPASKGSSKGSWYHLESANISVRNVNEAPRDVAVGQVVEFKNLPCGKPLTFIIKPYDELDPKEIFDEDFQEKGKPIYHWRWRDTQITRQIECSTRKVDLGVLKIQGDWYEVAYRK